MLSKLFLKTAKACRPFGGGGEGAVEDVRAGGPSGEAERVVRHSSSVEEEGERGETDMINV
jgi:hypothetical protein